MSRRIDTSIASIQFQVNARQANAAMQALQDMSNDLNREIDKVKKNIENLGSGAVKENPAFVTLDNQLKGLESDLKDVMKAQKDFMRGAKAADQLWKAASDGNIESLSFRSIRTGINGLKKRQEGLQPGDAQDMKDYRIIKQVIEEADRVVKAAGNDVQNVVQTIREGGKVSEQTMRQTINTLRDLKGSVDETDADFVAWGKDLDFMEAKMQDFNEAQRRAKGEIVDYDDAVKEMNKLTAEGAKAAKEQTAVAEEKIETLKKENETLAKNRAEIKENIRLTQEEMDNQQKSIEQKHREIEARERLWAEDQRPAYEGSIDDAKRKAQAERELANQKSDAAETQKRYTEVLTQKTEELEQKVARLNEQLTAVQQQKPAPNPVLEGVKQGAEEAVVSLEEVQRVMKGVINEEYAKSGSAMDTMQKMMQGAIPGLPDPSVATRRAALRLGGFTGIVDKDEQAGGFMGTYTQVKKFNDMVMDYFANLKFENGGFSWDEDMPMSFVNAKGQLFDVSHLRDLTEKEKEKIAKMTSDELQRFVMKLFKEQFGEVKAAIGGGLDERYWVAQKGGMDALKKVMNLEEWKNGVPVGVQETQAEADARSNLTAQTTLLIKEEKGLADTKKSALETIEEEINGINKETQAIKNRREEIAKEHEEQLAAYEAEKKRLTNHPGELNAAEQRLFETEQEFEKIGASFKRKKTDYREEDLRKFESRFGVFSDFFGSGRRAFGSGADESEINAYKNKLYDNIQKGNIDTVKKELETIKSLIDQIKQASKDGSIEGNPNLQLDSLKKLRAEYEKVLKVVGDLDERYDEAFFDWMEVKEPSAAYEKLMKMREIPESMRKEVDELDQKESEVEERWHDALKRRNEARDAEKQKTKEQTQATEKEAEAIQKKNQELERTKSYIKLEEDNISRNQGYYDQAIKDLKEMGLAEKDITDQAKIQEAIEKKTLEIMEAEVNAEKEAAEQRRELVSKITSSQLGGSKADQEFYAKHAGEYELSQYKDTDEIMERIAHLEMVSKLKNGKRFSDDTHWDPDDEVDEDELYVMTDEEKEAALNELRILKQHIREELLKTLNIEGDLDKAVRELTGGDGFSEDAKFGEQLNDKIQSIKENIDKKIQTSLDKYDDIVNMEYREALDDNGKLDKEKVRRNVAEYIEDTIQEASGSKANIDESRESIKEYKEDIVRLNGEIEKLNQTEAQSNDQSEEELRLKGELEQAQKDLTISKENQNKAEQESIRLQGEAAEQGRIAAKAEGEYAQAEADMVDKQAEINRQQDEALADIDKMGQGYEGLKTKMEGYEQQLEENGKAYAKNAQDQAEAEQQKQQSRQLSIKRMEEMLAVMQKEYREEELTAEQREEHIRQIQQLEKAISTEKAKPALQMMTERMDNLGALSASAVTETKKFWEAMVAGAEKGSEKLEEAKKHLAAITEEEQKRSMAAAKQQVRGLFGDLSKMNGEEIRAAINAGKQLIDTYDSGSPAAKRLTQAIIDAEEHVKSYGLEAERAARREEQAVKDAIERRKEQDQLMRGQLDQGTSLSESALKQQQQYWQRLIDDPKTAKESLAGYRYELERTNKLIEQQANASNTDKASILGGNLSDYSEGEIRAAIEAGKQLIQTYKSGSIEAESMGNYIARAEEHLKQYGLEAQRNAIRQDESIKKIKDEGAEVLQQAQDGGFATASISALDEAIKKLKAYQALINDPNGAGAETFAATKEQIDGLTAKLNALKGVAEKSTGTFASADEVMTRWAEHMNAGKTASEGMAQTLDEKLAGATSLWDEHIERASQSVEHYKKNVQEATSDLNEMEKELSELEKKHNNSSWFRKQTSAYKREGRRIEELRDLIEGEDFIRKDGSIGNTGQRAWIKNREQQLQWWQDELNNLKRLKAAKLGLSEEETAAEDKKRESMRLTQEQMQEGIKLLEQEYAATDHTTENGIKRRAELRSTIEQMQQEIKEATGEWMKLADAEKLAEQAGKDTFLNKEGKGFIASPEDIQKATQALERRRDALIKNMKTSGEATKEQERELADLTKKIKDLKFEQDNLNMSQEKMQMLMRTPTNAVSLDELRAAIKRADAELKRMEGSLGQNNAQYKAFAEQVKNAKNQLKEMEGQAKASATAWEKAWNRLKTYVVMYMGFNAVWQKMVGTADDIMELSDKMGEVRKTTGFTADEVGRLSDKLAELDTRTGLTNLMSISAKAGQLGLKNMEDVMGFTEAANKLMVALPEMGEEAATQMMKVAIATGEVNKIQKEMDEGVTEGSSATAVALERIGSTIDQLRANSAAAAPQITDFVKRVGAVGAQSNISIDQVAALGSTVDALGMRVEMSATALSRMIPAIKRNAFEVAKAIGMAPNALRQMFDEAGGGMNAMLAIFQHIKDAGMNADDIEKMMGMGGMTDIMKDLNQQGARAGIVFAGLSQNVDELRRQLGVAKTAYEENIAIQNEYDKMNETTAAKWERLSNKIEEMFVGDASQNALGVIIDGLRTIIDLITGPLSTAFNTTVLAVTAIKTGLTEIPSKIGGFFDYLKESAMKAGEELQKAANATGDIAKTAEGIEGAGDAVSDISDALGDAQEAGEQAGEAMETATGAIEGMTGATRVSIFSVKGLKTAWKGLDTTMKANIIVAVVALLYTLGKALYNALTETSKYSKAVADANAMIQIAIDRFEGYWEKLKETAAALDRAKKSTEGLKEGSDQLTKATIDLTKADNANKAAIADINSIYGKYLGFMLTEANYANLSAAAHDKVAAAIRREMLAKQQQAAIDQVTQENTENLKDGLANLTEELREDGRLNNQEAAKAKSAVQKFMRENIKFNTASGEYEVSQQAYQYLTGKGANLDKLKGLNPNQLAAGWFYEYLKENFHLNDAALADITGVFPQGGSYRKTNVGGRNFRGDYASAYLDNMQDVAEVQDVFAGDLGDAQKEDRKATTKLVEKLKKQADAAKAKITDKSTSEKERNAAYEDLANALEGLDGSIDQLNPVENKTLIDAVKKQADDISKSVDKDKLLRARTNARSIFARATGSENGYTPEVPLTPESNPWGEKLGADSTDWKNMTAEQLVNRRKQMKDFVNAIQTDSDVKTVLAEDAALKKAIENGMASDMRTVIEWYNTERLKIQDELHARHLTNTGDWMDPKKVKARKKLLHDETRMFLDELDAYYTERKAKIQEAGIEEGITEAEMKNRTLANEAEWRQRRMELQKMYGDKAEEVTQKEQNAIFNIIAERTDDDVKVIKGLYQKTLDFVEKVSKMGEQGEKEAREFRAKMDKQAMQDLLKEQNAMHQQMKAIQDIIDKERPFNGITKNLRENLVTMGILTADMTEERNRLMAEGADMADFNARQAAEELKRTAFMLGEAENAYTTTIEDIMKRMADAGMTAWADELKANPKMREALIAQLHQTYDDIQEAIKKEASLMKKQAENMWNNILLPGGDGKTTVKDAFEQTISQLGIDQGRVSRANSLIGAGAASERVADRLAIKQMKLQLTMQEHYFNLMRKQGQQRIDDLKRQADELERQGELEKASRVRQDKAHAEMSLRLATTKEQTELLKQQEDIIARTEESQNRLYKELKEWGDLLANSMRDLMEASNAGNAEYYNELAKLNLTGKGGPGAGTYIVIDNEGTSDATAHYEYLDERQALERQHEIEQENARAEAWKKVWDDLNAKMNEQITDWMNAALQNESIDANTNAVNANTAALNNLTWAVQSDTIDKATRRDDNIPNTTIEKIGYETTSPSESTSPIENGSPIPFTEDGLAQRQEMAWAYGETVISTNEQIIESTNKVQEAFNRQFHSQAEGTKTTNKLMQQSTQSTFAKMTAAANLYGIAYQTMSNDNLDASQKFELFALQAAGNAAIGMLTTNLFKQEADQMVKMPGILGELLGQMPYPVAMATYAAVTALMGGLMGMAVSKVAKSKSQIAQVTGASASAGRLATGMLTYAEGNVNEFTDPGSLTPGKQYNVDGRDGKTYRARYMGEGAKTHITNGPEFHLVGEKGREAIIDAHTTRNIQLNEPEIWGAIKTLYNGGSLRHSTRRRGVRAFADGNIDEFEMADGGSMMAGGMDLAAVKDSLDRNSAVQEALLERLNEPIVAQNILYGPDGLPAILKKLQKEANRHGEKYL